MIISLLKTNGQRWQVLIIFYSQAKPTGLLETREIKNRLRGESFLTYYKTGSMEVRSN